MHMACTWHAHAHRTRHSFASPSCPFSFHLAHHVPSRCRSYWPTTHPLAAAPVACMVAVWSDGSECLLPATTDFYWRRDMSSGVQWPRSKDGMCEVKSWEGWSDSKGNTAALSAARGSFALNEQMGGVTRPVDQVLHALHPYMGSAPYDHDGDHPNMVGAPCARGAARGDFPWQLAHASANGCGRFARAARASARGGWHGSEGPHSVGEADAIGRRAAQPKGEVKACKSQ